MASKTPTFEGFGRHVPGEGPKPCPICIVGEAPGFNEDQQGRPFIGQAGHLLNGCLRRVGLDRQTVYVTNAIKRRPPHNRKPTTAEIRAETAGLEDEMVQVQPKVIVAMGDVALRALTGKSGITKHRGVEMSWGPTTLLLPTFHPAYALRNPAMTDTIVADLRRAWALVEGKPEDTVEVRIIHSVGDLTPDEYDSLVGALVVAYDVETTGLDPQDTTKEMLGIGVAVSKDAGFYFLPPTWGWLRDRFWGNLSAKYVAHNGKFDNRWLARYGIHVNQTFDTMLAAYTLDENRSTYKLERLAVEILGVAPYHEETEAALSGGQGAEIPHERLAERCVRDCIYTLRLYHLQREEIVKDVGLRRVFQHLMMPVSRLLEGVENTGLPLDLDLLDERRRLLHEAMGAHKAAAHESIGDDSLNLNSTKVLRQILYTQLGLPIVKMTKGGKPSTDHEVLVHLQDKSPFVNHLMNHRKCSKFDGYYTRWRERAVGMHE